MNDEAKSPADEEVTINFGVVTGDDINPLPVMDELASLKQRADLMGVPYPGNIGINALKKKIDEHMNPPQPIAPNPVGQKANTVNTVALEGAISAEEVAAIELSHQNQLPLNEVTDKAVLRRRLREECMFLVRVRITNLNPAKKEVPAEWVTVGNSHLGVVRKLIPFGESTDNGYHIPKILLDELRSRKFLSLKMRKDPVTKQEIPDQQWVNEFAIEELPYLTREELDRLAREQAARASTSDGGSNTAGTLA